MHYYIVTHCQDDPNGDEESMQTVYVCEFPIARDAAMMYLKYIPTQDCDVKLVEFGVDSIAELHREDHTKIWAFNKVGVLVEE